MQLNYIAQTSKQSVCDIIHLYEKLNLVNIKREIALREFYILLKWNDHLGYLTFNQLQRLWIKLLKKYKFKYQEWHEVTSSENIHTYLFEESGNCLQSLIRFYQDRQLILWKESAFSYGLQQLTSQNKMTNLAMYFLTQVICFKWQKDYHKDPSFMTYFQTTKQLKVKALFNAYEAYLNQQNLVTATKLHQLLATYNPQFKALGKNTPIFFKQLDTFVSRC